jgi:hypothetical protein
MTNRTYRDPGDAWPWSLIDMPVTIKDLIGRKVRVVRADDVVAADFEPGRITILVSENHEIEDIKIEPRTRTK